ncbi:MAG: DnaD domain protein [Chloroflexi bacterium]|nr:DnaD domain protein [Chloroflexota bacterium]
MKEFIGFPVKMQYTAVPNLFLSSILPDLNNINEVKIILTIFRLLYQKKGTPRFITYKELRETISNLSDLDVQQGIELASQHNIIIKVSIIDCEKHHDLYFINTEKDRIEAAKISNGELPIERLPVGDPIAPVTQLNVFTIYENNIGMLTPMIAEQLKEAELEYPASWIEEAIKEAVSLNKRNWRYIAKILQNWAAEGKDSGKSGAYSQEDKYLRGKYGHLIKH